MKRLVEDTFCLTAREAAAALPKDAATGTVELEIAGIYVQQITLVSTFSNIEGLIKWFICPACQRRVGKLYLPAGELVFLCRKCHDLAYRAQVDRAFKKPEQPRDRLKRKRTERDWLKEAMAFLKKMKSKQNRNGPQASYNGDR
jgi:hypothetical protein